MIALANKIFGIPPVSAAHPIRYREYEIYPNRDWIDKHDRWMFTHEGFDGLEDDRFGFGATVEECREAVDERAA